MRRLLPIFTALFSSLFFFCADAIAADPPTSVAGVIATTAVGTWTTIDDETHEPKSLVEITQDGEKLIGKITKIFPKPGEDPDPKCTKCNGDKKDQPIVGMTILWDLKNDGDLRWSEGHILDPKNGKTYGCRMNLASDGKTLHVRGFLGISLLGRSQDWFRAK